LAARVKLFEVEDSLIYEVIWPEFDSLSLGPMGVGLKALKDKLIHFSKHFTTCSLFVTIVALYMAYNVKDKRPLFCWRD
jgi:hypothetical protein